MDIKNMKGIAIVAVDDGSRVGAVGDALFDLDNKRVKALVVGSGGLFGGSDRILDMNDVKSIGTDAVMIESRDNLIAERNDARYQSFPNLGKVTSLRVVSEGGSLVGDLASLMFDPASGDITDIEIAQHGLFASFRAHMSVPAASVVRFGQDVVVIPNEYAPADGNESDETRSENQSSQVETPPTS